MAAPRVRDRGQAAVELALALPVVAMVVLGILQVVLVGRNQLAVEVAAREGARAAAVAAAPDSAARAAAERSTSLRPLQVSVRTSGDTVTVTVGHRDPTNVPLVGAFTGEITLDASVTMAREPP